ncbi:hypothetical protein GGX14DRAFT_542730 [Mycena pura]|uniref:Uncharacterized protein n=1 Tax=Mycena pura TaxID=153505 RepID=A0AAD6VMZ2_9AGAR|nr:hypothetical protein GGX14DRAFT_542730 [Mycena pura]
MWLPHCAFEQGANEPKSATFYRSFEYVESVSAYFPASQLGAIEIPHCYKFGAEDEPSRNFELTDACVLAIPQIVDILNDASGMHPVCTNYDTYWRQNRRTVSAFGPSQRDAGWLEHLGLCLSPGMEAVVMEGLSRLFHLEHQGKLRPQSRKTRAQSIACVFFQCLAIQQELGEIWDLNGHTFEEFLAGAIVRDTNAQAAQRALDLLRGSAYDPAEFKENHMKLVLPRAMVVVRRQRNETNPIMPPIPLRHEGREIRREADLPRGLHLPQEQRARRPRKVRWADDQGLAADERKAPQHDGPDVQLQPNITDVQVSSMESAPGFSMEDVHSQQTNVAATRSRSIFEPSQ